MGVIKQKKPLTVLEIGSLAVLSTWVLLRATHYQLNVLSSLDIVFLLGLNYYVYQKLVHDCPKRTSLWVVSALFGGIVATILVLGGSVDRYGSAFIGNWKTWVKVILLIPSFTSLALWLYSDVIPTVNNRLDVIKLRPLKNRYVFWGAWALIILMWIPTLLATMPGNYGYDSGWQIVHYYNTHDYGLHHPLAHTWLLVIFVLDIGKGLLHSSRIGLLLYTIFQMALLSGALAAIILTMKQRKIAVIVRWITLMIFGISPYFAVTAISTTKNTVYSAFFIILILLLIQKEWVLPLLKNRQLLYWGLITIIAFLNVIFINQGIYVVIFGFILGVIAQSRDRWKILGCLVSIVCMYKIYTVPVYNALNLKLEDGRYAESMSVPVMQLANVYDNNGNLSNYEKKEIQEYIGNLGVYTQTQALSDPVKASFNIGKFKHNELGFLKFYITIGAKNPSLYVDALANLSLGDWYPGFSLPLKRTYLKNQYLEYRGNWDYTNNPDWYQIKVAPVKGATQLSNYYDHLFLAYPDSQIAILRVPNTPGFAMMVWLLLVGWYCLKKKNQYVAALGMILGLCGTLLLGPIAIYRYSFPVIVMTPIMITLLIGNNFGGRSKQPDHSNIRVPGAGKDS